MEKLYLLSNISELINLCIPQCFFYYREKLQLLIVASRWTCRSINIRQNKGKNKTQAQHSPPPSKNFPSPLFFLSIFRIHLIKVERYPRIIILFLIGTVLMLCDCCTIFNWRISRKILKRFLWFDWACFESLNRRNEI